MFKKRILTFKDFMFEVFDTSHEITKTEKINNVTFYYFKVQSTEYRIFVEEGDTKEYHVGFEVYDITKRDYVIKGITNNLSAKEVLGIFGTILKILKGLKPELVFVRSEEQKKHRLYVNMMSRLLRELELDVIEHDDASTVIRKHNNQGNSKFVLKGRDK